MVYKIYGATIGQSLDEVSLVQGLQAQQVWWEINDQHFRMTATRAGASRQLKSILG